MVRCSVASKTLLIISGITSSAGQMKLFSFLRTHRSKYLHQVKQIEESDIPQYLQHTVQLRADLQPLLHKLNKLSVSGYRIQVNTKPLMVNFIRQTGIREFR